jgi:flagellar protein FlaJ
MIKIPYSFIPPKMVVKASHMFIGIAEALKPFQLNLELNLKQAEMKVSARDYIAMCFFTSLVNFFFLTVILFLMIGSLKKGAYLVVIPFVTVIFVGFMFFQQLMYPQVKANRRVKDIDKNLLPALRTFLIQINSGVPIFNILVMISSRNYGEISRVFGEAVKDINAGRSQVEVMEDMATINPSLYFRRAIWQISNAMRSGSDISTVIKEVINALSQEQLVQIQKYGSQLNPLAMFYMMVVVIIPTLGMTFLLIITSLISTSEEFTKIIFWGLYIFVLFFQLMFIGLIKAKRPNLMSN